MIIFDIGGTSTHANVFNTTYIFQPIPWKSNSNVHVIPMAVSNVTGTQTFYVSSEWNKANSSLCQFNTNLRNTWASHTQLNVSESIQVQVTRLDDFMTQHNIDHIDFLKMDARGKDLEVLQGLGTKITNLKAGSMIAPVNQLVKMYKDQSYVQKDAIHFLEQHGFKVTRKTRNDKYGNEYIIHFTR